MADISVVAPRDIYEERNGQMILIARKGQRMTVDEAIKHKLMPIGSASLGSMETK